MGRIIAPMCSPESPPRPPFRRGRLAGRRLAGPLMGSPAWARLVHGAHRGPVRRMAEISREEGVPPLLTVAVALVETGLRNADVPGNPGKGWFQMRLHELPYSTSERRPTLEEAHDLEFATREFCRAAAWHAEVDPSYRRDLTRWAIKTQGVGDHLWRNEPFLPANFAGYLREAAGLLRAFGSLDSTA